MKELLYALYGTWIYLPLSGWIRRRKRIRHGNTESIQQTTLPEIRWANHHSSKRRARLYEAGKQNGNVRVSELSILCSLAADCRDNTNIIEIGTFDGRTTLNLALNSPPGCRIFSLDLPPGEIPGDINPGERHLAIQSGHVRRIEPYRTTHPDAISKIVLLQGNSMTFDWRPYERSCSLVFVDASHAYDYVRKDSEAALRLINSDGVIVWHDYGVWKDVTLALETLDRERSLGLRNIRGTSLAIKSGQTSTRLQDKTASTSSAQKIKTPDTAIFSIHSLVLVTAFIMLSAYVASLLALAPRLSSHTLSVVFDEGGVIESSTIWIWLGLAAILLVHCRGHQRVQQFLLSILCLAAAARGADWHRLFTEQSIFKLSYYMSSAPGMEKFVAAAAATAVLSLSVYALFKGLIYIRDGGYLQPAGQLLVLALILLIATKFLDRAPALFEELSLINLSITTRQLALIIEEGLELGMAAVFMAATLWHSRSRPKTKRKSSFAT